MFLKYLKKVYFEKKSADENKIVKICPACKELNQELKFERGFTNKIKILDNATGDNGLINRKLSFDYNKTSHEDHTKN